MTTTHNQGEPIGYLADYEMKRLRAGSDAYLRSSKFGASALDGDVAVFLATSASEATPPDGTVVDVLLHHAADLLDNNAAALKSCRTVGGDWTGDEEAKAVHDDESTTAARLRILAARARDTALPGWRLLPIEPTPEMSAKGFCVSEGEQDPAGVYRAMVAAAPAAAPAAGDAARKCHAGLYEDCGNDFGCAGCPSPEAVLKARDVGVSDALPSENAIEAAAEVLWNHFAPEHGAVWNDCTRQGEYRSAAQDVLAARVREAEPTDEIPPKQLGDYLTLTGSELLDALELVAPDAFNSATGLVERNHEQMEGSVCIGRLADSLSDDENHTGPGVFAWDAEYPEEGVMPIRLDSQACLSVADTALLTGEAAPVAVVDAKPTLWEAFEMGFALRSALLGHVHDGRDVGRLTVCEFWHPSMLGMHVGTDLHVGLSVGEATARLKGEIRRRLDAFDAALVSLAAPSAARPLDESELALLTKTADEFADCNETLTDHATLMHWANMGLLECECFIVTPAGEALIAGRGTPDAAKGEPT